MATQERPPRRLRRLATAGAIFAAGYTVTDWPQLHTQRTPNSELDKAKPADRQLTKDKPTTEKISKAEAQKIEVDKIVGPAIARFGESTLAAFSPYEQKMKDAYKSSDPYRYFVERTPNFDGSGTDKITISDNGSDPDRSSSTLTSFRIVVEVSSSDPTQIRRFSHSSDIITYEFDSVKNELKRNKKGERIINYSSTTYSEFTYGQDGHWVVKNGIYSPNKRLLRTDEVGQEINQVAKSQITSGILKP